MFTYRVKVGRKYGGWLVSDRCFDSVAAVQAEIDDLASCERQCGSSPYIRRVVAL